jgi:hypothetical protein
MGCSVTDRYVALNKMALKNCNYCLSFVTTLWKGEVIMCVFNNLSKEIAQIYCIQELEPDDVRDLEDMIKIFIYGG